MGEMLEEGAATEAAVAAVVGKNGTAYATKYTVLKFPLKNLSSTCLHCVMYQRLLWHAHAVRVARVMGCRSSGRHCHPNFCGQLKDATSLYAKTCIPFTA